MNGEDRAWLCAKTGWSPQQLSNVTTGRRGGNMASVKCLAAAFGVPVSEFIKWGEE